MRRLFIGVNFTNEEKEHFALVQDILKKYCDRAKYTRKENFHLTFKFLGLIPDEMEEKLIEIINTMEFENLTIQTEHIGFFSKKRGYIAYIGFKIQPELAKLVTDLNNTLMDVGVVEKDEFIYTPHITLSRNTHFLVPLVDVSKGLDIEKELPITNITLFESINIDGVLTYRPLYTRKVI